MPSLFETKGRIVLIDVVRGLSILMVLAAHLGIARFISGLDGPPVHGLMKGWHLLARNGGYGVYLFFVLSGFLITRILITSGSSPLESISLRDFYSRRVARILPLLALVCLIDAAMFIGRQPAPSIRLEYCFQRASTPLAGWVSIWLFMFNWYRIWHARYFPDFGLHLAVLWSLSIEEQFYLAYPLIVKKFSSLRPVTAVLAFFVVLGPFSRWLTYRLQPDAIIPNLINSFSAFDSIAIGCLLFFACRKTHPYLKKHAWLAAALFVTGSAWLVATYIGTNSANALDHIYTPTSLAFGLFLLLSGGLAFPIKETKMIRLLCLPGQLSYGLYLLHATLLFFGWTYLMMPNPWTAFGFFVLLNTIVGYFAFHYFERPANGWVRARLQP